MGSSALLLLSVGRVMRDDGRLAVCVGVWLLMSPAPWFLVADEFSFPAVSSFGFGVTLVSLADFSCSVSPTFAIKGVSCSNADGMLSPLVWFWTENFSSASSVIFKIPGVRFGSISSNGSSLFLFLDSDDAEAIEQIEDSLLNPLNVKFFL